MLILLTMILLINLIVFMKSNKVSGQSLTTMECLGDCFRTQPQSALHSCQVRFDVVSPSIYFSKKLRLGRCVIRVKLFLKLRFGARLVEVERYVPMYQLLRSFRNECHSEKILRREVDDFSKFLSLGYTSRRKLPLMVNSIGLGRKKSLTEQEQVTQSRK